MTSLQNGNYNSRSMNGLTSIYANDITCDTIETTDATITNNLSVGNGLSVNGVSTFNNDLIIYDKGSPVYPYRFRTIGRRLVLQYDNPTTRTYFDCSFNAFGSPQLFFPNQTSFTFSAFFNSDLYIADTKRIFLGDITGTVAATIQYTQATKNLTLTSGIGGGTASNIILQTNNAAGAPFQITFNPTQLSIPVNIDATGNYTSTNGNITLTNGIISQAASITNQNTIKETTITGTSPITIYPRRPPSSDASMTNAIVFKDAVAVSGRSGFFLQTASGLDLINFGVNTFYFGNRNTARASGNIRFDTRNTGTAHIIQFRIERPGTTATSELVWACDEPTSRNINFLDNEHRLKALFRDTITPFTNYTEISKIGASLTIAGLNASSTLTISNRNASNVASNTFVNSTATTDITSTTINLSATNVNSGALTLASNADLTFQGTGKIVQTLFAGTNAMGPITIYANGDLTFQGTGRINQNVSTGTNIMRTITQSGTATIDQSLGTTGSNVLKETTFNSNADLTQQGTGKIVQSATAGTNTLGAITMNSNADLTQQGTGKIVQSATAGTNTLGAITMNSNADLTQQGTGKIVQSATAGTNTLGAITMNNNTSLTYQDGSIQNTAYQETELSDTYFHSKVSGRNILCSSFNLADNPSAAAFTGLSTTSYFFYPLKVVKNVSYTGVGIFAGTTSTNGWEIALYEGFINNPARLKTTGTVSTTAGVMNYFAFTGGAYVPTATDIVYVGLRNLLAGQTAYFLPQNNYMSLQNPVVMTNGTLNKRGQSCPGSVAFPANLGAGTVMTVNNFLPYIVLYN